MRLGKLALGLGLALGITLCACKSEEPRAAAPPSGTHGRKPDTGGVNSGSGGTSEPTADAGKEDAAMMMGSGDGGIAPLVTECDNVAVVSVIETDMPEARLVNAITAPTDLRVSRVLSSWGPSCATPTIEIRMSDGSCPLGNGHELRFSLDVLEIIGGTIGRGVNTLVAEPDTGGIRVRYTRSDAVDPEGLWGSCNDANGTISLLDDIDVNDLDHIYGQFQLELTGCDDASTGVQVVNGTFDANMRRNLSDVCPDFM